jgi:hypothetical protein
LSLTIAQAEVRERKNLLRLNNTLKGTSIYMIATKQRFAFFLKRLIVLSLFALPSFAAMAQDPGEPCDSPDPITSDCTVPLDSWVIVLVAVAFCYGIYRLHKKQKALSA